MTDLFDKNGNAVETLVVTVSGFSALTSEFEATYDVRILKGTGIPGFSTMTIAPAADEGYAACWDGEAWQHVIDLRKRKAYNKSTGKEDVVKTLGPLDDSYTLLAPATNHDVWNGSEWVTDANAAHAAEVAVAVQKKNSLRAAADSEISWRQDAIDAGIATEQEISQLAEWRKYRVLLMRVNPDDVVAIEWPAVPDGAEDVEA